MPKNIISVVTEYDLTKLDPSIGSYYYCTDSNTLYKDTSKLLLGRKRVNCIMLARESEREGRVRPVNGRFYFVIESTVLYQYDTGWRIVAATTRRYNAYTTSQGVVGPVTSGSQNEYIDNNGLLGDGSVVIRDANRIIRSRIYTDDNENMILSSLSGNEIQILPNGTPGGQGSLILRRQLNDLDRYSGIGIFTGEWNTYGDMYVNSTVLTYVNVVPDLDSYIKTYIDSSAKLKDTRGIIYKKETHFVIDVVDEKTATIHVTEVDNKNGNTIGYDASGNQIYTGDGKITNDYYVDSVRKMSDDGRTLTYTLTNGEIITIDVSTASAKLPAGYSDAESVTTNTYWVRHNKVWHSGIFDPTKIEIDADKVYQLLQTITDTPLNLDVDKIDGKHADDFAQKSHSHTATDVTDLRGAIYEHMNKSITGGNQSGIRVTKRESGNNIYYDYNVNDFSISVEDESTGNIMGSVLITDLNSNTLRLSIDPNGHKHNYSISDLSGYDNLVNIIDSKLSSSEAISISSGIAGSSNSGKLLRLDSQGSLRANITGQSSSALRLAAGRKISLKDGVSGEGVFDGSKDIEISITVDPNKHIHKGYVLASDDVGSNEDKVGVSVAPLDRSTGLIPEKYLPVSSMNESVVYQGRWDPSTGNPPSDSPKKGQYWVSSSKGLVNGITYSSGDWIVYNGSSWDYIINQASSSSSGESSAYFIYSRPGISGEKFDVPFDKAVITDAYNHAPITAADADALGGISSSGYLRSFEEQKADFSDTVTGAYGVKSSISIANSSITEWSNVVLPLANSKISELVIGSTSNMTEIFHRSYDRSTYSWSSWKGLNAMYFNGMTSADFLQNDTSSYASFGDIPLRGGMYAVKSSASDGPSEVSSGMYWTCLMARMGFHKYRYLQIALYRGSGSNNVYPYIYVRGVSGEDDSSTGISSTGSWKKLNAADADTLDGYHASDFVMKSDTSYAKIQVLSSDPTSPSEGDIWIRSDLS